MLKNLSITLAMLLCPAAVAVDHAALVGALDEAAVERGRQIFSQNCVACHGPDGLTSAMPQARAFAKDELLHGTDPLSMWQTLDKGVGLMPPVLHLNAAERYDVVHFIRQEFIAQSPAKQYQPVDQAYLDSLKALVEEGGQDAAADPTDGMIDTQDGAQMDYGSVIHHSVTLVRGSEKKGIESIIAPRTASIRVAGLTVCYDLDRCDIVGIWSGEFLDLEKTHYRRYKGKTNARPGGTVVAKNIDGTYGWQTESAFFAGREWSDDRQVMRFEIDGRQVYESVEAVGEHAVRRGLSIAPGDQPLTFALADYMRVVGADGMVADGQLVIPASESMTHCTVVYAVETDKKSDQSQANAEEVISEFGDVSGLAADPQRIWSQDVNTQGTVGAPEGGYINDELTLPYRNPWGSWLRPSCIGHFEDGRVAIGTWSGDVWVVSGLDDNLANLQWQRVVAGLYEPMGLLVRDGDIHVRTRDGIYRLKDRNGDGEIDALVTVYADPNVLPAYNSYVFGLEVDSQGRFYFAKAGYKVKDLINGNYGRVVRVSADGKQEEVLATGMREPNGLSVGPNDEVVVTDNQGQWIPSSKLMIIPDHQIFGGFAPEAFGRQKEQGFDQPFLWLPHAVDKSSGQAVWAPAEWGPYGGQLVHTSYGSAAMLAIFQQNIGEVTNGFAVDLGLQFATGIMRASADVQRNQVYVAGLVGYDYHGPKSDNQGAVYRVRVADEPPQAVTKVAVISGGLRLTFNQPVSGNLTAADWRASAWNYLWTESYGSKEYTLADAEVEGKTEWAVESVRVGDDPHVVEVAIPDLALCQQFEVQIALPDGWTETIWGTINAIP